MYRMQVSELGFGAMPAEEDEEDDAEGPEVVSRQDGGVGGRSRELFRSDVIDRTKDPNHRMGNTRQATEPKVHDFEGGGRARINEQAILGLKITMNDMHMVQRSESGRDLAHHGGGVAFGVPALLQDTVEELAAFTKLENKVDHAAAGRAVLVHVDEVHHIGVRGHHVHDPHHDHDLVPDEHRARVLVERLDGHRQRVLLPDPNSHRAESARAQHRPDMKIVLQPPRRHCSLLTARCTDCDNKGLVVLAG